MSLAPVPDEPGDALADAIRRRAGSGAAALADVRAVVRFEAGPLARCSVALRDGVVRILLGNPKATTVVSSDLATLLDVVEGRTSGVAAFLDSRLRVDGDLSLSLRLDSVFTGERPARFPRSAMVDAGGLRTFHLDAGPLDGVPIVGLHGLGATNASLLPCVWDLAQDYRVLAPDLPGHGASAAPRGRYDAPFFARWFVAYLDEIGVDRAVLLGNSLGGRVALEVAMLVPDRIRGLALLAPAMAFRRLRQLVPAVRLARPELAAIPLPVSRSVVRLAIRLMFAHPTRLTAQSYDAAAGEFVRVFRRPAYRIAFFSAMRQIYLDDAFGVEGFWRRLPSLDLPALFIWGARDRLVPAGFARHVTDAMPHAHSVVFEDCGHVPQFELPERTHAEIRAFVHTLPA